MSAGILNGQQVQSQLIDGDAPAIKMGNSPVVKPDASSIDLPLGEKIWELPASVRPSKDQAVVDVLKQVDARAMPLTSRTVLQKNKVYLVEVAWAEIRLPPQICAHATAKSSVGRLDVLVRLVTDNQPEFDRMSLGARARLYVEIIPLTFDIVIAPGMSLSQIRFFRGHDHLCLVSQEELSLESSPVLVYRNGSSAVTDSQGDSHSILLCLDATDDTALGFAGFCAKTSDDMAPVDPSLRKPKDGKSDQRPKPEDYWEPVHQDACTGGILIKRDRFYILRSRERFRIPAHMAVECQAYAESLGDIRIHYAGFAHPFFGLDRNEGTPLIFEVRGFSLNTILRNGAPLAKVQFRRMSLPADAASAEKTYSLQELNLSACFLPWSA